MAFRKSMGFSGVVALGAAVWMFVCAASVASATTVFDNTGLTGDYGPGIGFNELNNPNAQIGDEVTLAGVERIVQQLIVAIRAQSDNVNISSTLRFYAQDGVGGAPGSLLYQSSATPMLVGTTPQQFAFNVPDVVVPDTFTWTVEFAGGTPFVIGVPDHDPIAIGSSPTHIWVKQDGQPFQKVSAILSGTGQLAARIEAVPEPATGMLLLLGATALMRRRVRTH